MADDIYLEDKKIGRYEDRLLWLTDAKRHRCKAVINNIFCSNFTKTALTENIQPSGSPNLCSFGCTLPQPSPFREGEEQASKQCEESCKTHMSDGTATFPLSLWEREKILNERSEVSILGEGSTSPSSGTECHLLPQRGEGNGLLKHGGQSGVQHDENNSPKRTYSPIHLFTYSLHKKAAFTLAEVLITLGIIGVVAALTIPSLIADYKEKEIITKAKKDYSLITQALKLAQAEAGTPGDNSILYTGAETSDDVAKAFSKYITGGNLCLSSSKDKLCKDLKYKILYSAYKNKYGSVAPPAIVLPDNSVIFITLNECKCVDTVKTGANLDSDGNIIYNPDGSPSMWTDTRNTCGNIYFDVNGTKGPNKFGYDAFGISVFPDRAGRDYWNVYGADSLFSILTGGKLKYNNVVEED